jgi:hypothetical protein
LDSWASRVKLHKMEWMSEKTLDFKAVVLYFAFVIRTE